MFDLVTNNIYNKEFKCRFFQKVQGAQTSECWIWDGAVSDSGYGWMRYRKEYLLAHRISYTMFYDEIPKDKLVLHKCDIKRCVSPYHLYIGTYSDNMYDRAERDRESFNYQRYSQFNKADAVVMQSLKKQGFTYESIANVFGVTGHTISDILNNRTTSLREK